MILDRYIFKELLKSQIVVLLVLIAIFAAQSLIRLVTDAASGDMPAVLITKFLLFSMPEFLALLLPLTLYVSLIITLGRICTDSEMVVMRAVGFSPQRIMMIAMFLAAVSAVLAGYVGLVLTPKAALATQELEIQATENPEFLPIDSGRFVSFGKYNIYVEDVQGHDSKDKQVSNVFVIDSETPNELSITVARQGHMAIDNEGIRWLVLNDGRRYENPANGSFRIGNFEQFKAPLSGNVIDANPKGEKLSTKSSYELLTSNNLSAQVEFQWRISPVFAVLVMCMVAVPLSMVNPRQGRFTRLMPAIIIYVAYYLFLLSLRNMVRTGALPIYPGLYLVPICFLLLVAIPLNMPKTYLKHISTKKARAASVAEAQAKFEVHAASQNQFESQTKSQANTSDISPEAQAWAKAKAQVDAAQAKDEVDSPAKAKKLAEVRDGNKAESQVDDKVKAAQEHLQSGKLDLTAANDQLNIEPVNTQSQDKRGE